jgi:dUTP pyrophosphatase
MELIFPRILDIHTLVDVDLHYATEYSAGFDIKSASDAYIKPYTRVLIPTGLRLFTDVSSLRVVTAGTGFEYVLELQIRPRSSVACKHGIIIPNSPATIDLDYTGEIMVCLANLGDKDYYVEKGDKIAQGVWSMALRHPSFSVANKVRGTGGFGSTGR